MKTLFCTVGLTLAFPTQFSEEISKDIIECIRKPGRQTFITRKFDLALPSAKPDAPIFHDFDPTEPDPDAPANRKNILTGSPQYRRSYATDYGETIGHLYEIQTEAQLIPIVHVYGSHYNMGKAQGMLMGDNIKQFYGEVSEYALDFYVVRVRTCLKHYHPALEPNINSEIIRELAETARQTELDDLMEKMGPYIPQSFTDEVQGLADAIDVDANYILELHLSTELQKSSCSFIGAWGKALMSTDGNSNLHGESTNHMLHARAVQGELNGPFRNNHQITVYHPTKENALMSWSGFIGSVTAVNDQGLTASTMEVSFPDTTFKFNDPKPTTGIPFAFLLRQILHNSSNHYEMTDHLRSARRTRNLILGLGDGKNGWFNSVQYSPNVLYFRTDYNLRPGEQCEEPKPCDWHPLFDNVVYHGNDWNSPGHNSKLGQLIGDYHGKISYRNMITDILARSQSGEVQAAVFHVDEEKAYVSFSRPSGHENAYAYSQAYTKLDVRSLFNTKAEQKG